MSPLFRGGEGMAHGSVSGGISDKTWRVRTLDGAGDWFIKVPGKMHVLAALGLTKTVFDMIDEHAAQCRDLDAARFRNHDRVMLNKSMTREALMASGLDLVSCFADPVPGNVMIRPDGSIRLIDCEHSSMNNRCHDPGIWLGKMSFTPAQEMALIDAEA